MLTRLHRSARWQETIHPLHTAALRLSGRFTVYAVCFLCVWLPMAAAFCGGTARASLSVREDARHADLWFRYYDELPRAWKTRRTVKLREMSPRDMARLIAKLNDEETDRQDESVVDGCYQSGDEDEDTPIITLCDTLRGEQASLVFTHEYGHFVWDALLTDAQRARYTRLWKSQKRAHRLVTEYAQDSDEEGFAEAFAYFIRKPAQLLRRDAASMQFFKDILATRPAETTP